MAQIMEKFQKSYPQVLHCAKIFHNLTGLPCTITTVSGDLVVEFGYGCNKCDICQQMGVACGVSAKTHSYALNVAVERFGGKYIYVGPTGFTYFVSPLLDDGRPIGKITVGPFLMVDHEDYLEMEGHDRFGDDAQAMARLATSLSNLPVMSPELVQDQADLLFMATGFLGQVQDFSRLLEAQDYNHMQTKISGHLLSYKQSNDPIPYPFETEQAILSAVAAGKKQDVQKHLNEMFGYLFFSTSGDLPLAKTRVYELLVLIARTAIKHGAPSEVCLSMTHNYFQTLPTISTMDGLCIWLSKITNQFVDSVFSFIDTKHPNVIQTAVQYINEHYHEKISL